MAGAMVISMAACGNSADTAGNAGSADTEASDAADTAADEAYEFDSAASIDFSDGKYAFLGSDKTVNPAAKDTLFELVDRNDRKAVKVTSSDNSKIFAAIQMDALLGDKISDVASVELGIETELGDSFTATAGHVYAFLGGEQTDLGAWSIYLENKNPKTVTGNLSGAAEGDYLVLTLEDSGSGSLDGGALYIYTISFKDASGNVIAADTSAEYVAVDTGADRSNLFGITGAVTIDGLAGTADGWAQIGYIDIPEDALEILQTPGSVVEISYTSETGNMWMGLSGDGWQRIGVGDADCSGAGYSYVNNSKNIAQVTYETIASVVGEDTSKWDKQIFIESDGAFEVFSVKVGMQAPNYGISNAIDVGLSGTADGWAQIDYGISLSDEAFEMLTTPGSIVKVEYTSEDGDCWIVMSGDSGWFRVGVGNADGSGAEDCYADGSVCYVTYDQIKAVYEANGITDIADWAHCIVVESDTPFEVFSLSVGMEADAAPNNRQIDVGLSGKADGWAQINYDLSLSDEAFEALTTPGSVVQVAYTSEDGDCWIVMSGDSGWFRVGVGNADGSGAEDCYADGSVCYVTYDQIKAVYEANGITDTADWAHCIVVESDTPFEVYSLKIGQS